MICKKCCKEIPNDSVFCCFCGFQQNRTYAKRKPKSRGNGQGSVYKRGNKYEAQKTLYYYMDGDKRKIKRIRKLFKTKKEANEWLVVATKCEQKVNKTFAAIYKKVQRTEKYANLSKSKLSAYKIAWNKLKSIHTMDIDAVSLDDLNNVVDSVANSFYTKRDIKSLLNKIYRYAEINELVNKNIAVFLELPPEPKSKREAFTLDEIKTLYRDYTNNYVDTEQHIMVGIILTMCFLGTRYGEISIIKKSDIDLEKMYLIGGIKTDAGKNRYIPIPRIISDIFIDIYNYSNSNKLISFSEDHFYKLWHDQISRLGLRKELTPHCCRHTYATVLAEADVQPAIIKELAGHKNYATTLQYTHIANRKKSDTINNVAESILSDN